MSTTENATTKAIAIVNYLVQRGHFVDFDFRDRSVSINPMPAKAIVERIVANDVILTNFFASLYAKPATGHLFCASAERVPEPGYALCLACGVPWACHGEPARERWALIDDVSRVVLRDCAPLPVPCVTEVAAA